MDEERPIFVFLRKIPEDDVAMAAMKATSALGVQYVDELSNYSTDDFSAHGIDEVGMASIEKTLANLDISLKPTVNVPLQTLLTLIESPEITQELQRYFRFVEYKTVKDVTTGGKRSLTEKGVSDAAVSVLEQVLQSHYRRTFEEPRPEPVSMETVRGYEVIDNKDHLLVNGARIVVKQDSRQYPKEKLIEMYRLHSAGKDAREISRDLGLGQQSIVGYLRRANVIPAVASYHLRGRDSPASGAPPPSMLELRRS